MTSNEDAIWRRWAEGRGRCPLCLGLDDEEFAAVCDCSRASIEAGRGQPMLRVRGTEIVVPIGPTPARRPGLDTPRWAILKILAVVAILFWIPLLVAWWWLLW